MRQGRIRCRCPWALIQRVRNSDPIEANRCHPFAADICCLTKQVRILPYIRPLVAVQHRYLTRPEWRLACFLLRAKGVERDLMLEKSISLVELYRKNRYADLTDSTMIFPVRSGQQRCISP